VLSLVGAESIVGLGSSTPPSSTGVEAVATFSVVVLSLVLTEALFPAIGMFRRLMGRLLLPSTFIGALGSSS